MVLGFVFIKVDPEYLQKQSLTDGVFWLDEVDTTVLSET